MKCVLPYLYFPIDYNVALYLYHMAHSHRSSFPVYIARVERTRSVIAPVFYHWANLALDNME